MTTIHCVDVSASMSDEQLKRARQEVQKRYVSGDTIVIFDVSYKVVENLELPFDSYCDSVIGRYGTDATAVLKFVKNQGAKSILYSDGWLSGRDQFDTFIDIQ